jgi:hypothetical protein
VILRYSQEHAVYHQSWSSLLLRRVHKNRFDPLYTDENKEVNIITMTIFDREIETNGINKLSSLMKLVMKSSTMITTIALISC